MRPPPPPPALLELPFAKHILAFELLHPHQCSAAYAGLSPYVEAGSGVYVRWATDSLERLMNQPHDELLDEALMQLAVYAGEPSATLNAWDIRAALRRLCTVLYMPPILGTQAARLFALGVLEDMVNGILPPERDRQVLRCLHWLAWEHTHDTALEKFTDFYWELDELDDLNRLGLARGLPTQAEVLQRFRAYACALYAEMRLEPE